MYSGLSTVGFRVGLGFELVLVWDVWGLFRFGLGFLGSV